MPVRLTKYYLMYRFGYGWSIPICGTLPPNSNLPITVGGNPLKTSPMTFQVATVWQWNVNPIQNPDSNYYLGLYNSSLWTYGILNNAFAVGYCTNLQSGETTGCTNSIHRSSCVYLQCNPNYNATNPKIVSRELSTCICKYFLR
jgi:hypothetical protein